MSVVGIGDLEFNALSDVDEVIDKWAGFTHDFYPWPVFHAPIIGGIAKKLYNIFNKPLYCSTGDFISKRVQAAALKGACDLYLKLKSSESLSDYLAGYKESSGFSFKIADVGKDLANIYADVLFDERLIDGEVGGFYTKVFSRINKFMSKQGLDFAFVLGNNDLSYDLFTPRFLELRRLGMRKLKFVDRRVENVSGYRIAGFGGSPEYSSTLASGESFIASMISDPKLLGKVKGEYRSLVADVNGFEEAKSELLHYNSANVLLIHKEYNSASGDFLWGSNPGLSPMSQDFIPIIQELIKHFNPSRIVSGHAHGGAGFGKDGVYHINPGVRGLARTHEWSADGKPELVIKPYGDMSGQEVGGVNSGLKKSLGRLISGKSEKVKKSKKPEKFKKTLDGILSDESTLSDKLKGEFESFPELELMKSKKYAGGKTVFEHTMKLYDYLFSDSDYQSLDGQAKKFLKLSVLLHDVVRGSRHELRSAVKAKELLTNWGYDQLTVESVSSLIKYHRALGSLVLRGEVNYTMKTIADEFKAIKDGFAETMVELLRLLHHADMGSVVQKGKWFDANTVQVTNKLSNVQQLKGLAIDEVASMVKTLL